MATLFERMWQGEVPSLSVFKSEKLGIMAILANPQETPGQLVVFPERAVPTYEELTVGEVNNMDFAMGGLARVLKARLNVERVVRHIEGYGVPDHAHGVLLPSYQRGDSDRIHHPAPRLPFDEFADKYSPLQQLLGVSEEFMESELAARRQVLVEDAT